MICAIPFHQGDIDQAKNLVTWIVELGVTPGHKCFLVPDADTAFDEVLEIRNIAARAFKAVEIFPNQEPVSGWIAGSCSLFKAAAMACAGRPFLFLEPDAVPLSQNWLNEIEIAYLAHDKPSGGAFMGSVVSHSTPGWPNPYFEGVGVYPRDAWASMEPVFKPDVSWTNACASVAVPRAVNSPLFQHLWGQNGNPPTFASVGVRGTRVFSPSQIQKGAVVFHRNKDGTLISLLREKNGIKTKAECKIDRGPYPIGSLPVGANRIVSLRRGGDVIALLPLLKHFAEKLHSPVELVVHSDFVSILDGVSYVKPVPWSGSWEEPLTAAAQLGGLNAQVFGRGVKPTKRGKNFVNTAWEMLGYQWDRYMPLIFDRRDEAREELLAASTFKTDKPKLLVKLHGFSSPFKDSQAVLDRLWARFKDTAEIVELDKIKAERIYDLIGLMDRADCMLSTDTATLHLCRASKVPVVALVNGGVFGSSPSVGNVILRVPYSNALSSMSEIEKAIFHALEPEQPAAKMGICLVHSEFTPADKETAERHKRAMDTWPRLGAMVLPFAPARDSSSIGDPKKMPFVRDMIEAALEAFPDSIVAISNNDVGFHHGLAEEVIWSCSQTGCYWSYRLDGTTGKTDMGADFFAFTPKWWRLHERFFPDFLLGYCWWDDMLGRLMLWSGCEEQRRLVFHEPHPGAIVTRPHAPGAAYNERLAMEWMRTYSEHRKKPHEK